MSKDQKKVEKLFRSTLIKLCRETPTPEILYNKIKAAIPYLLLIYDKPSHSKWYLEELEEKFRKDLNL